MPGCEMSRTAFWAAGWLVGCTAAPKDDISEDSNTTDGVDDTAVNIDWPAVDTSTECPAVDFSAANPYTLTTDVVYDVEAGEELLLDLYVPDLPAPRPGVVMVHGGGFTSGSRGYMDRAAEHYASAGFVVLNVEYRRIPAVGLDDLVRDVICSVHWGLSQAEAIGLEPTCLGTMGESAGGYLVSMVSLGGAEPSFVQGCDADTDLQALFRWSVPYYGISDLPAFAEASGLGALMPGLAELAGMSVEELSPTSYVGRDPGVGFFLPHGTADTVVPPSQSEVFFAALESAGHPVELRLLEGVPHGFMTGDGFLGEANGRVQGDIETFVVRMNASR